MVLDERSGGQQSDYNTSWWKYECLYQISWQSNICWTIPVWWNWPTLPSLEFILSWKKTAFVCAIVVLRQLCTDVCSALSGVGLHSKFKFIKSWPELHWPLSQPIAVHCLNWKMDEKLITSVFELSEMYNNKLASHQDPTKRKFTLQNI